MNAYIQVKLPDPYVQVKSNDNAISVSGQTADGYVNKSFLADDPALEDKLTGLVGDMTSHQRSQLAAACGEQAPALADFDEQIEALNDQLNELLTPKTKGE